MLHMKSTIQRPAHFLSSAPEIEAWLQKNKITNYTIHDDLRVSTTSEVALNYALDYFPCQFKEVQRFDCRGIGLKSLVGAPSVVERQFECDKNKLANLIGAPRWVGASFTCSHNKLTSLQGAPEFVGNIFECSNNLLTNFMGAPKMVDGDFVPLDNPLQSLEGLCTEIPKNSILWLPLSFDYVVKAVVSNYEKRLDKKNNNCYLYGNEFSQYVAMIQEKMKLQDNLPLVAHTGLETDKKFKI